MFPEMGRGSVSAVTLGPTYTVTAHNEKVPVNLTSKTVCKTTYVIIFFLELQMRGTRINMCLT